MSRRDEAITTVDSLLTAVRSQVTDAIHEARSQHDPNSAGPSDRPNRSLRRASSAAVDRLRTALQQAHAASPLGEQYAPTPASTAPTTGAAPPRPPPSSRTPADPTPDGDVLPGYSRTAREAAEAASAIDPALPPRRPRPLQSKTGKLALDLNERGADRIVVVQEVPDADTSVQGTLTLTLPQPETISHVRIRLKGIVRTLVFKAHASGRHPVSDEVCFFEDSVRLWQRSDADGNLQEPPPGNGLPPQTYKAAGKLVGQFQFPFRLTIPSRLTHMPETGQPYEPRPIRPPPSFMLDASATSSSPAGNLLSSSPQAIGGFEGSCRYYLKVTLGRIGLLKLNERWIVPLVFAPRQLVPASPSPLREIALAESNPPPSSVDDPEGWTEPGKYVTRTALRKSGNLFRSSAVKGGWVRLEGRVPRPQRFVKGHGELLEFEVQLTCSDAASLARFVPATIAVSLLQRTIVTAQGLSNTHDNIVLRANRVIALPTREGRSVRGRDGNEAFETVYAGALKLTPTLAASFRAPNLQVAYLLCITLYQPTEPKSSGATITPSTHLSSLALPVEIISTPPLRRPLHRPAAPDPETLLTHAAAFSPALDAIRANQAEGPNGGAATGLEGLAAHAVGTGAAPPPEYPARPSHEDLSASGSSSTSMQVQAANGAPAPSPAFERPPSPVPGPSRPSPAPAPATPTPSSSRRVDLVEENRLEEMYGLPPSYFEVVEGTAGAGDRDG